ncbi:Methylenetetrahydrofolate reductase [Hondaea fermentalgiana]|uniref:Methylenetetrahydrofolate reductase n=1 Tax=Hondaea fermentalgiana TaxID=2315210 RepID=A0A2R5GQV6_9STRA|nr:Methylenetetrahydrofolate reductase [Hondaea fermentalgiana]|eukprot:GBG32138.1 Methylenetetrahydrofolate reductase [Hondaea fermentalgiana]
MEPLATAQTTEDADKVIQRIAEMGEALQPTFVSLTWRSAYKDEDVWLKIGSIVQKQLGIAVLLHLTCHLPREDLVRVLRKAREAGIRNVLALRGDAPHVTAGAANASAGPQQPGWRAVKNGFRNAIELVHLIRAEHGDYFCVGVAGYPEVHTSSWNSPVLPPSAQAREQDLIRLKDKVDAGADFVITQFFYEVDVFFKFRERCQDLGINVPIIPGYAPIQNYSSFQRFKSWVRPQVPAQIETKLNEIKDDDERVQAYGVEVGVEQIRALLRRDVHAVHFFTLNLASAVTSILQRLRLRDTSLTQPRQLPWRGLAREQEEVRPIFWAHRHSSYLSRTSAWSEFPNGRWGDARSAATFELGDYYLASKERSNIDLRELWGVPTSPADVAAVFVRYMRGEIAQLPWCDQQLAAETETISEELCWINRNGFLTINSQPKVNGVSSSSARYGWGGDGGVCFQKAYVEFFCSPEMWFKLRSCIDALPPGRLSYHAVNVAGDEFLDSDLRHREEKDHEGAVVAAHSDTSPVLASDVPARRKVSFADELVEAKAARPGRVNAVTWGVFPGREIIQPTVVDTESFRVWKAEAFELWLSQWAATYEESAEGGGMTSDRDAQAVRVLRSIHDTWFLVNIVDNDYVNEESNIFEVFKTVILDEMSAKELRSRVDSLERENAHLYRELLRARSQVDALSKSPEE